jgi:hypothetical protein
MKEWQTSIRKTYKTMRGYITIARKCPISNSWKSKDAGCKCCVWW